MISMEESYRDYDSFMQSNTYTYTRLDYRFIDRKHKKWKHSFIR